LRKVKNESAGVNFLIVKMDKNMIVSHGLMDMRLTTAIGQTYLCIAQNQE